MSRFDSQRIVQIIPPKSPHFAVYRGAPSFVSPVVCWALVERVEGGKRYRSVMPMVITDGALDLADDADNYEGVHEFGEAQATLDELNSAPKKS